MNHEQVQAPIGSETMNQEPTQASREQLMEQIQEDWYHTADGPSGTVVVVCALLLKGGDRVEGVLHTTKAAMDKSLNPVWQAAYAKAVDRLMELYGFPHAAELHAEMRRVHPGVDKQPIQVIVGGVGQSAPRVTIEQIEAEIESEHYFTAAQGEQQTQEDAYEGCSAVLNVLKRTLFCVLVLKNGMRVGGVNHGSVSAANYSVEYARKDAREKAIDKLWPMFGFELAQKLYREKQAAGVSSLGSAEGKFRKKSGETARAVLYTGFPASSKEVNLFVGKAGPVNRVGFQRIEAGYIAIPELPDGTRVFPGDWVVKNAAGEFSTCKPDIFAATYQAG